MSVYFVKGKGWRYDFTLSRNRYSGAWLKTKTEAREAEVERRKEIREGGTAPAPPLETTRTDMGFLELVNRRLDHVKAYNSERHYTDHRYMSRRWIMRWGSLQVSDITRESIEEFLLKRAKVSRYTANKELRFLRATFNFAKKRRLAVTDPTEGICFLPVEKRIRYVPPQADIEQVIAAAEDATRDYLIAIRETMGRMSEINRLTWRDVSFAERFVTLYTRKKRGGHLTPRRIPMTEELFAALKRREREKHQQLDWVFYHTYRSNKTGEERIGPFSERKRIMKTLCRKVGVPYFRFHALRHAGASLLDSCNVPVGSIQRILGHENRTTTEIYLHSIGETERQAMKIFERVRKNSHTESHTEIP